MHRTFRTSSKRQRRTLEGIWDFCIDPDDRGVGEGWCERFPREHESLWVPGVWNTHRSYLNYEGVAWYRRRFRTHAHRAMTVHFAAVTHQANVWLDGEPLGEHYGGFLPFSFSVNAPEPGEHELIVRVDNTHSSTRTIPSSNLDWFRYGGIFRPVWLDLHDSTAYVDSLRLCPVVNGDHVALNVRAELISVSDQPEHHTWRFFLDGDILREEDVTLAPRESHVIMFGLRLSDVERWSPENPRLYAACMDIGEDDLMERTGFREIKVQGNRVLLNGAPLTIHGVNRHEDHPDWGFALPEHMMLRDLELLADWGGNAIRGSHYPNDQRFLDLCDERGVLFMEEIPLWGYSREQLAEDIIGDRAAAMTWAMVERDINHPSIWAWSVLNECATDTLEGQLLVSRLAETVRELDRTRPVTYATDRGVADLCFDLVDLVCINAYPGWYGHDLSWRQLLDRMRVQVGRKPIIISEFGAGAVPGFRALEEGVIWSEEYQAQILTESIAHFLDRADVTGFYVWQFFDTRTDGGPDGRRALARPRSHNNKGMLNEYRQPKLAYYAVRELLANRNSS